jgi:hypothetical protein
VTNAAPAQTGTGFSDPNLYTYTSVETPTATPSESQSAPISVNLDFTGANLSGVDQGAFKTMVTEAVTDSMTRVLRDNGAHL